MPAGIVKWKGKWYVLLTTYDIHHRGEAEEHVAYKLEDKRHRVRLFPFDSWSDAVVLGNNLTDEFLDDWSARPYDMIFGEPSSAPAVKKEVAKVVLRTKVHTPKVQPEWKDKLKEVKGKPSVKVVVRKKRKLEK